MKLEIFKVKYIGEDTPSLRKGKVYDATYLQNRGKIVKTGYSVKNEEDDTYAYHSSLFERVEG